MLARTVSFGLLVGFVVSFAAALAPAAQAQGIQNCGELDLVFRNPDLQPQADGLVHASGRFFIQFQAIGETADQIKTFGFSFGQSAPSSTCDTPVWITGAYIQNYRADRDPADGFFIGLNTTLVPDGMYGAAVHAYDANDNELARFWASAIVDNCDGGDTSRCGDDPAQAQGNDKTQPWPIILPGDGTQPDSSVTGFSIEFAEALSNLTVSLNGQEVTAELEEYDGRLWDDDLIPGFGPAGLANVIAPECEQSPPQTCNHWGPAYRWNVRALTPADIIHVEATDMNGNVATKDIHVATAADSGAITGTVPNLQVSVDTLTATVKPGETAVFRYEMTNSGGGDAHPFTSFEGPAGWTMAFLPHEPVPSGETKVQEFSATAPMNATGGVYHINTTIAYPSGGGDTRLNWPLAITVDAEAGPADEVTTGEGGGKDSPGIGIVMLAALGLAVALRRRV